LLQTDYNLGNFFGQLKPLVARTMPTVWNEIMIVVPSSVQKNITASLT